MSDSEEEDFFGLATRVSARSKPNKASIEPPKHHKEASVQAKAALETEESSLLQDGPPSFTQAIYATSTEATPSFDPLALTKLVQDQKRAKIGAPAAQRSAADVVEVDAQGLRKLTEAQAATKAALAGHASTLVSASSLSLTPALSVKPTGKMRAKNNIMALAYDMAQKETELAEFHAEGRRTRQETKRKYGF